MTRPDWMECRRKLITYRAVVTMILIVRKLIPFNCRRMFRMNIKDLILVLPSVMTILYILVVSIGSLLPGDPLLR